MSVFLWCKVIHELFILISLSHSHMVEYVDTQLSPDTLLSSV